MSAGPIRAQRSAWMPPKVSTPDVHRICGVGGPVEGRGYCGRSSAKRAEDWEEVTCADCHAARRADQEAEK